MHPAAERFWRTIVTPDASEQNARSKSDRLPSHIRAKSV